MIITVKTALELLPIAVNLIGKVYTALTTKGPVSIEDEMAALEELRLRPSEDVIADADKESGKVI